MSTTTIPGPARTAARTLTAVGRVFFALGLVGLGASHFIFGQFVTGRAPAWPEGVPGGTAWAYGTGVAFIAIGAAILARRGGRPAALFAALLIFGWALLRNIPVVAADRLLGGQWTQGGKSLTLLGGALAVAATLPAVGAARDAAYLRMVNLRREFTTVGRLCLALFFIITGIQHYIFTAFVASLIPAWFPGDAVFWTYFAGVALVAGGVGLLAPWTARLAALLSGIMVFSWFWIVHLPRTLASVSDGIAVFEALAVAGIAFVLAGSLETGREH